MCTCMYVYSCMSFASEGTEVSLHLDLSCKRSHDLGLHTNLSTMLLVMKKLDASST